MGKVFKPKGVVKRRNVIDEAVRDLSPRIGETAKEILESWEGEVSEKRLVELLGEKKTKRILKKVRFEPETGSG
ncbi:MAG: hypothetical protein ACUVQ8_03635 [Nitrososphaeria archaeon]